jgi:hypothetical protein
MKSLIDFRAKVVEDSEEQQRIRVDRLGDEHSELMALLRVYQDRSPSLTKRPLVNFVNEPAEDVGAVTREYFDWGMGVLLTGSFDCQPQFEGQEGHRLPSANR